MKYFARLNGFRITGVLFVILGAVTLLPVRSRADTPVEKSIDAPHGLKVFVKMIGAVAQTTDLQIICILAHQPSGDRYIEAMKDLDGKLGGMISTLRDSGDFAGEMGETLLFTPPANSIAPSRMMLIGVGAESELTLDRLRLVGRIAAREAVRLDVQHVSFAPALRDQGSTRIEVAQSDAAMVEQFLLAYDTEKLLQSKGVSPADPLKDLTMEAGPKYFAAVETSVMGAVAASAEQISRRDAARKERSRDAQSSNGKKP